MIQQCCNFPTPILWYTILYAQECYIIYSGAQPCNYCWQTTNYIPPSNLTIFPIKNPYFRVEYSKSSPESTHVFILTRMPYGIDPPLTYTSPKISVLTPGFCRLCAVARCHAAGKVSALVLHQHLPPPEGQISQLTDFWLGLSQIQALLQNGGLDLGFPKLQDWGVWNFSTSSSLKATVWLCLWVPPTSAVVSPVSWPQSCSLHPKELYEPWHISIAELHSSEMLLGKKRRGRGSTQQNSPKMLPYIH